MNMVSAQNNNLNIDGDETPQLHVDATGVEESAEVQAKKRERYIEKQKVMMEVAPYYKSAWEAFHRDDFDEAEELAEKARNILTAAHISVPVGYEELASEIESARKKLS